MRSALTLLIVSARACVSEYVRTSVGIGSSRTRLRNYACRRSAVTDSTAVFVIIIGYVLLL